jgi:hypothetical protein
MRIFRDSVTPSAIPLGGISGVMGYANGLFRWTGEQAERFTAAGLQVAHIDVNGSAPGLAAILDVETGDAGPAQAPDWIRKRNAFRGDATIYCNLSTLPAVLAATSRVTSSWWLWLAHFTGHPHIPHVNVPPNVRIMGCQFASFENYDESCIVADNWHRRAS